MNNITKKNLDEILVLERRPVQVEPDKMYTEIGMYSFGRGIFHKQPRSGFEVGDKDLYLIREGDFIFQITFAWEGAIGLASKNEDRLYGSVRFPTFRIDEKVCFPRYLLNYFRTAEGREQLIKISPGSAGRNRVLSLKRLSEVSVSLPPLEEQRRIVARIEELAARIEEAKGLRHEAVEDGEKLFETVMNSYFNFNSSQKNIGNFASVIGGYAFPSDQYTENGSYQIVRIGNVRDGYLDLSRAPVKWNLQNDTKILKYTLNDGDILISMTGTRNKRDYGYIAIVPPGKKLLLNQRVGKIEPHSPIFKPYLAYFLRSSFFRDHLFPNATGTANQANIGNKHIENVPFNPPNSFNEQRRIVAYLDGLQAQIDMLKRKQAETQAELNALLPSILDKAFKGEL